MNFLGIFALGWGCSAKWRLGRFYRIAFRLSPIEVVERAKSVRPVEHTPSRQGGLQKLR
jgi:transposase